MTDTEIQLMAAIIAGFVLLALSVGAFATHRSRLGVTLLVLAAVATVVSYPLITKVARDQDDATREAIEQKYGIDVEDWGPPLGDATVWVIDGEQQSCEHIDLSDRDDPVLECVPLAVDDVP
ncbi:MULTISPECIES: hypothetical protein [unclassified Nocardioides]|uniref:hypothetical protein n=1 Tax=unclassified Nocardioides TaxID=2615069 RepID=UPI003620D023